MSSSPSNPPAIVVATISSVVAALVAIAVTVAPIIWPTNNGPSAPKESDEALTLRDRVSDSTILCFSLCYLITCLAASARLAHLEVVAWSITFQAQREARTTWERVTVVGGGPSHLARGGRRVVDVERFLSES